MAFRIATQSENRQRQPRVKDKNHLRFIATLPCLVCGLEGSTQACHVRFADLERGKRETGKAEKPDDKWTVPMCFKHHAEQHSMNEETFWEQQEIDVLAVCEALHDVSGHYEKAALIIAYPKRLS